MLLFITNNWWTRSFTLGYWPFYFSSAFDSDEDKSFARKIFFQMSMHVAFLPSSILWTVNLWLLVVVLCWTKLLLDQLYGKAHELVLSLPLRVYWLMRSTPNVLYGVVMTSLVLVHYHTFGCVSCFWQDLQDLSYDQMVLCIPLQSITDLVVSLRHEWLGLGNGDTNWLPYS
jgi:hypothetical protein